MTSNSHRVRQDLDATHVSLLFIPLSPSNGICSMYAEGASSHCTHLKTQT